MTHTTRQDAAGGRPRDAALDAAILAAGRTIVAADGIDALTISGVAAHAGTSRPAVYRRYASQAELAVAVLASMAQGDMRPRSGAHLEDLVAQLEDFRAAITTAHSITLVGSMLGGAVPEEVVDAYRAGIVAPRRAAVREILEAARRDGAVTGDDRDLDVAVTLCTGSWYAFALAGDDPPGDWPRRTAMLVWRALGGVGPPGRPD